MCFALFCTMLGFSNAVAQSSCPPPRTEVPFAKIVNEAFVRDYVGCDIATRVTFIAPGATPNYYWGHVKGTSGKAAFRVSIPGEEPNGGPFDLPPHVFVSKDIADAIFSFKKGDLLIIRGAPSVGPSGVAIAFIATEVRKADR